MQNVAVNGCTLQLSAGTGNISITNAPSQKVKCDGKEAYKGQIQFSISNYMGTNIVNGDGQGSGSINGTSRCLKIEGAAAVLQNDTSETVTVIGTKPSSSGSGVEPATDSVTVKVSNAGQAKVKAE